MPIEWVMISGAVMGFARKYLEHRLSDYADANLRLPGQTEILKKANQAFVDRFSRELDSVIDLPTVTEDSYQRALQTFLSHTEVQDKLAETLDGWSDLDWVSLKTHWDTLTDSSGNPMISLPGEFDWPALATTYHNALRRYMLADGAAREVLATGAAVQQLKLTEHIKTKVDHLGSLIRPFDLQRYRQALETAYGKLKIGALDSEGSYTDKRVRLTSIYTPQSVKPSIPPRDITRDYLRQLGELAAKTKALLEQDHGELSRESKAILENDEQNLVSFRLTRAEEMEQRVNRYKKQPTIPTSEVADSDKYQRVVLAGDPGLGKSTLLQVLALRWVEDQSRPLALLIELRHCSGEKHYGSFLEYLEHGTAPHCGLPALELHEYLRQNKSLVMFDGLDEAPADQRQSVVSSIIRFAQDYTGARIIVTTRIYGYYPGSTHPEQFQDAGFQQYTLQDLDDRNIERFIDAWHKEMFSDPEERSRLAARLLNGLENSPAIRELAANPLLLTMMAILNRYQELPRDRVVLYDRCAELLLAGWDLDKFPGLRDKHEGADLKSKLHIEQKRRILEQVAGAMQETPRELARNVISEERLKQTLEKELTRLSISPSWSIADDLIWMLRERNFMLAYVGDRQYSFVHRTFLEYFFARAIRHRYEVSHNLTEEQLLGIFLEHGRQDEWHEILLLTCALIEPDSAAKVITALLDRATGSNRVRLTFLAAQCLRGVRETEAVALVRDAVRQRLLSIKEMFWSNDFGLSSTEIETDFYVRGRALREIALGWPNDPSTLALLKQRAESEVSEHVRASAMSAVASGWGGQADVITWLMNRAEADPKVEVRVRALQHVSRVAGKDRRTAEWIQLRAQTDAELELRCAAVKELGRVWSGDPWLVPGLQAIAEGDTSGLVRHTASMELQRTLQRAESLDPHRDVAPRQMNQAN